MVERKDERIYITVHDGLPDHPKVEALSDKAFRLLIETWCWCSRHLTDGRIPLAVWRKRGTPRARRELVDAGLVEAYDDRIEMHDYLEHQSSAAEVEEKRQTKRRAGRLGNHKRWHVEKNVHDPQCDYCLADAPPDPPPPQDGPATDTRSQNQSHVRSQNASQDARKTSPPTPTPTPTDTYGHSALKRASAYHARPGAAELNATAARPDAWQLVADWHNQQPATYRTATRRQLAKRIDAILGDHGDPAAARDALDMWAARSDAGPGLLPSLYDDALKARHGARPGSRRNRDDKARGWMDLADDPNAAQPRSARDEKALGWLALAADDDTPPALTAIEGGRTA